MKTERESPSLLTQDDRSAPTTPPPTHIDYDQVGPSNLPPRTPQANTYVSPYDISPVPITKKRASNRGRKPVKSAVITSSPYKRDLEESEAKKKEKQKIVDQKILERRVKPNIKNKGKGKKTKTTKEREETVTKERKKRE